LPEVVTKQIIPKNLQQNHECQDNQDLLETPRQCELQELEEKVLGQKVLEKATKRVGL
jgi:hypothetical protein